MHPRPRPTRATLSLAVLLLLASPALARSDGRPAVADVDQGEVPHDPPRVAAPTDPATTPAARVAFGSFTSIQVNTGPGGNNLLGDAANEPSIAVDPLAPNRMAIGWRQFDTITSNFRQAGIATSADGGRTWTSVGPLEPGVFRSDPVLDFDNAGVFYYSSLTSDLTCDVFTSFDGGATWTLPVDAFGGDKQWLAVDRTAGIGAGHLYQIWSSTAGCCGLQTFTRSSDGAASFEVPVVPNGVPRRGTLEVGPDGTVYAGGVNPSDVSQFRVSRTANAQDAGATPSFVMTTVDMGGSLVRGIENFSLPNPNGLLGQVSVDVDPGDDTVYLLASVDPPGVDPMDVHIARSTDGGSSWETPVRVNDDAPAANAFQWFGTLSVAPDGRLDVVWVDTGASGMPNVGELRYSQSADQGLTWSPSQTLSPTWDSHLGHPNQNKIGDYYEMISDLVGAHLAWAATFNGEQDVYYLRIGDYDCNGNGVGDAEDLDLGTSEDANDNGIPDECEDVIVTVPGDAAGPTLGGAGGAHRARPNPFRVATRMTFDTVPAGADARLDIYDVGGRRVRTPFQGALSGTSLSVDWDGTDASGSPVAPGRYFGRLVMAGEVRTIALSLVE